MSTTLTIRLSDDLDQWLEETSRKTGLPKGRIVKMELERAQQSLARPFLALAGTISGPPNLSVRKGFSRA